MTFFTKTLAACASALFLAGAAAAQTGFSVDFTYSPSAPAAETYEGFKRTAEKACRAEYGRGFDTVRMRQHLVSTCKAQVLDQVVEQVASPAILALHNPEEAAPRWRLVAQR